MTLVISEVTGFVTVVFSLAEDVDTFWVEVLVVITSMEELGLLAEDETGVMTLVPVETWQISEEHSVIVVKIVVN